MNEEAKLYHFVTGRPPMSRTQQTDTNMRFFLKHQRNFTETQIERFMDRLPRANVRIDRPWGSTFMTPDGLLPGSVDDAK